jgi:hypothetical protein
MSVRNTVSSLIASPQFLRRVLWLDAATGLATGLLQLLLAAELSRWLGLPVALLQLSGAALLVFAAAIAWMATRPLVPAPQVWLLVGANLAWVLGCLALLFGGFLAPTLWGQAFVAVQAVTVGLLAELQYFGLRKVQARAAW